MKKIILILGGIILIVIAILLCILIFNNPFLSIKLNGEKEDCLEVNSEYKDPKVKALIFNKNISDKVKIKSKLDIKKVGSYNITYTIKYLGTVKKTSRIVRVVDKTKPIMTLIGNEIITLNKGETYTEQNVEVTDNYDTNLKDKVEITSNVDTNKKGEYEIVYKVKDSSGNETSIKRKVIVNEVVKGITSSISDTSSSVPPTYINGILLVNKKYGLPSNYGGGIDPEALAQLHLLQSDALAIGYNIPTLSAYRSYQTQATLYNNYYQRDGEVANTYSAKPGHSEHQTGLAFDVGEMEYTYGETPAGKWLYDNCANYGFIIRYPSGKESITGYVYEPWHIRYVGVGVAKDIMSRGITLEEYLGV